MPLEKEGKHTQTPNFKLEYCLANQEMVQTENSDRNSCKNFHRQQRFETHVRCRMAVGDGISIRTARLSSWQLDQIFSRQFSAIDPSSHVRIASAPALLSNPCEIAMLTQSANFMQNALLSFLLKKKELRELKCADQDIPKLKLMLKRALDTYPYHTPAFSRNGSGAQVRSVVGFEGCQGLLRLLEKHPVVAGSPGCTLKLSLVWCCGPSGVHQT